MNKTNHIAQGCYQGTRMQKSTCSSSRAAAGSAHSIYVIRFFSQSFRENCSSLAMYPRLALNLWPSCPSLLGVGITGMCRHSRQCLLLPLLLLMMPWSLGNFKVCLWWVFFPPYPLQCLRVSCILILPKLVRSLLELENLFLGNIWK